MKIVENIDIKDKTFLFFDSHKRQDFENYLKVGYLKCTLQVTEVKNITCTRI
jgi:hypothetical protein